MIALPKPPPFFPVISILLTGCLPSHSAEPERLTLSTDFPGGSAEIVALDEAAGFMHIRPALRTDRGWPCWWYFRIDGATPGRKLTLQVSGNPGVFRPGGAALAANWAQPVRASISTDDRLWEQTGDAVIDPATKIASYPITAPASRFWLAWGPPFLPSDADELLERTARSCPGSERFILAETKGGQPVPGIRIGNADAPMAVWVQARQHAWEAGGSWVGRGFLEWVSGDAPEAVALRKSTAIYFIPIMDVDNVTLGAGGKDAVPRDHNRDWADQPVYPEVAAAQARIAELEGDGRLRLFIDLHNPGPGDKRPFFFGPFDYEELADPARKTYDRWIGLAAAEISSPLPLQPAYRFATYVKTTEERGRMSSGWVRNQTDPARVVAVTLETAWNTPESTAEGYLAVGRQLGRTVGKFLQDRPPTRAAP